MKKQKYVTFHTWLDYWREMYYRPSVASSTYNINEYYIRIVKAHFPDKKLSDISPFDCQRFLNLLYDENYARSSIKKCATILRKAFSKAHLEGKITSSPVTDITIPKAHTKKVDALTQKEQAAIEFFCDNTLYGDYMRFLLYTGLRVGEMINLKWSDFDPIERIIHIRKSKTDSGVRSMYLIEKAFKIIISQTKSEKDNFIFHNIHGNQISYSSMKKCYEKLRQKTGIEDFTNHVCRHSFATRLTECGANPKCVAGALGHKKVEYALNIYTDIEMQALKKQVFLLEQKNALPSGAALDICVKFIYQRFGYNVPEVILEIYKQLNIREDVQPSNESKHLQHEDI